MCLKRVKILGILGMLHPSLRNKARDKNAIFIRASISYRVKSRLDSDGFYVCVFRHE